MTAIPTERDFSPDGGPLGEYALDERVAWEHFGGLTLDQARSKFLENPSYYQEDFMWMGGRAFVFYFRVIDEYLRSAPDPINEDNKEAWILAKGIQRQFEVWPITVRPLLECVLELCEYVLSHLHHFAYCEKELVRIEKAWRELRSAVLDSIHL